MIEKLWKIDEMMINASNNKSMNWQTTIQGTPKAPPQLSATVSKVSATLTMGEPNSTGRHKWRLEWAKQKTSPPRDMKTHNGKEGEARTRFASASPGRFQLQFVNRSEDWLPTGSQLEASHRNHLSWDSSTAVKRQASEQKIHENNMIQYVHQCCMPFINRCI